MAVAKHNSDIEQLSLGLHFNVCDAPASSSPRESCFTSLGWTSVAKKCSRCKAVKSVSAFSRNKNAKDGLQWECKECARISNNNYKSAHRDAHLARRRAWRAAHAEQERQRQKLWRQRNREQEKARHKANHAKEDKLLVSARRKALYLKNYARDQLKNKEWVDRNRDKTRASASARKARKLKASGSDYTKGHHVAARMAMFGHRCYICGREERHIDHVKPLKKHGSHWPANLRPICKSCNSIKKVRWTGVSGLAELIAAIKTRSDEIFLAKNTPSEKIIHFLSFSA